MHNRIKWLITPICLIISYTSLFAQNTDSIVARAYYSYSHLLDINQKDKFYTEDMLLALGKTASVYTSLSKINQNNSIMNQAKEQTKSYTGDGFPVIRYSPGRFTSSTEVYRFNLEAKLFIKENLYRDYLYEEIYPIIDWQIVSDTSTIKGISCQKATCQFKGREWTVWFAPELPFQTGPWQLGGLPGLILEASDRNKEIKFTFQGFEKSKPRIQNPEAVDEFKLKDYTQTAVIALPNERIAANNRVRLVRTTKSNIIKLKAAMENDINTFKKAQLEATNGVVYDEEAYQSLSLQPKFSSPIDLSKK